MNLVKSIVVHDSRIQELYVPFVFAHMNYCEVVMFKKTHKEDIHLSIKTYTVRGKLHKPITNLNLYS